MRKKIMLAVLCGALAVTLGACGKITAHEDIANSIRIPSAGTEEETSQATAQPEEQPEVQPEEQPEAQSSEMVADYQPEITFSAYDVTGDRTVDETVFQGYTLTMVNFWEPWCGPCVAEMPDLEKLYEDLGGGSGEMNIIGVYSTEEDAAEVLQQCGTTYPVLQYVGEFNSLQSDYVPNTVFFDGNGKIVRSDKADIDGFIFVGSRSYDDWKSLMEELSR